MYEISKYGAGATESLVHPAAIVALIVTVLLIFLLPRNKVIIAVLCFVILIPSGQQFYVGGVHLFIYRIMVLAGLIVVRNRNRQNQLQNYAGGWNAIDTSFTLYVIMHAVAFSFQYMEYEAVINQFGFVWDYLGGYSLMRALIIDNDDVERALKCVSYVFAIIAVCMIIEQIYMFNLFGYLGGQFLPELRENRFRSVGPFQHPITVGNVAAATLPLFMFLWYQGKNRFAALLGMIAATIITITVHSSGPLIVFAAGIIGLLAWPGRKSMRLIRRTAAFSLVLLHLVMKAPVWFLIARVDLTGSSSSYHRANLIDQFIGHFPEWWLIGTPNHNQWGYDLTDVQNQYVSAGVDGGLATLICFVAIIIYGFSVIGEARKSSIDEIQERFLWVIGVTLFSFMIAFLGVNLFDQSRVLWFMFLAMVSAVTSSVTSPENMSWGYYVDH